MVDALSHDHDVGARGIVMLHNHLTSPRVGDSAEARSAETTARPVTPPEPQLPAPPAIHPWRPEEVHLRPEGMADLLMSSSFLDDGFGSAVLAA